MIVMPAFHALVKVRWICGPTSSALGRMISGN